MQFMPKDQVAYIPNHADGDINHPDVEFGFVTSKNTVFVFVRFFWKDKPDAIRTHGNSEPCSAEDLVLLPWENPHFKPLSVIEGYMEKLSQGNFI